MVIDTSKTIGVIVGRFQVPELHIGHRFLIEHVASIHPKILILVGISGKTRTNRYPLKFEERAKMIKEAYPNLDLKVLPIEDHPVSSFYWSKNLDAILEKTFPKEKPILYGSRDSFIPLYSGKFEVVEIFSEKPESSTGIRRELKFPHTKDARSAIIHEMENRFPVMYATADVAVIDKTKERVILIGKKSHESLLSFPGGFIEKNDRSAKEATLREFSEEVPGVSISNLRLADVVAIDDPRYRNSKDGIMTSFYIADYVSGEPNAGDDADFAKWVKKEDLMDILVPWHQPLGEILLKHWTE